METLTRSDWTWLPANLLDSIISHLRLPADYVRFGAVCKRWRFVAIEQSRYQNKTSKKRTNNNNIIKVPLLMVPSTKDDSSSEERRRGLFDVFSGKNLPGADEGILVPFNNRRCCGYSHGWLAFAMEDTSIILFHPLLGKRIELPRILKSGKPFYNAEYFIKKVVLSADPLEVQEDGHYEVVSIYGGMNELKVIKGGQDRWERIPVEKFYKIFNASDVNYYRGIIHAVNVHNRYKFGRVLSIDTITRQIKTVAQWRVNTEDEIDMVQANAYLVESCCGDLLLVNRLLSFESDIPENSPQEGLTVGWTSRLLVYKLAKDDDDQNQKKKMLVRKEVNDLGDEAIFLGDNQSLSVLASEVPGCQPNSIYFTDDYIHFEYPEGPGDIGIYKLKDKSFERHFNLPSEVHKKLPPPIWIWNNRMPNLAF